MSSTTAVARLTSRLAFRIPLAIVALGVVIVIPHVLSSYWLSMVVLITILGLFALSHDLLMGHTGLVSLGQTAFFGIAAYTAALLQVRYGQPWWVAVIAAIVFATLLAAILGFAVRSKGIYFILLTMALGLIVWGTAGRWTRLTHGDSGISGVRLPEMAGIPIGRLVYYWYVVAVVVTLCVLAYARLIRSPFGLTLRGIRESESRMLGLGYRVAMHKYVAFVISGFLSGLAGVLFVYYNNFISPTSIELIKAAEAVLAVIIGGMGTIAGPFIGAAIITIVRQELSAEIGRYMTVLGVIFVLTAMYAADGLLGQLRKLQVWFERRRKAAEGASIEQNDKAGVA